MMEKQISKKKLERLTISGGDFRKAGARSESTNLTINKLRKLLEDDVNDLMKRKNDVAASLQDMSGDAAASPEDITEDELNLIMDREKLFQILESESEADLLETPAKDSNLDINKSAAITPSSNSTTSSGSKRKLSLEKENFPAVGSSVSTTNVITTSVSSAVGVPLEGRMYDVISVEQFSLSVS